MTENKQFVSIDDGLDFSIKHIESGEVFYDCESVVELLNELSEENYELKQQLLYDGDDVCSICKHEYLTPSGDYYTSKCEKGHEECSKEDKKYCKDFKLKELNDE